MPLGCRILIYRASFFYVLAIPCVTDHLIAFTMVVPIRGVNNIVIISVFGTIAVLVVILRVYARRLMRRPLGMNDYAAIAALVLSPLHSHNIRSANFVARYSVWEWVQMAS